MIDKLKNTKISDKNTIKIILFIIFMSMLVLNFLTPLIADDYSYAIGVTDRRISSIIDIVNYQVHHYFNWGGRTVAHSIAQFFLMFPKGIFNVFNSMIYTVLIYLIYKIAKVDNKKEKPYLLIGIHFILYFLTPVFGQTCIWLIGSCNYIWTTTIMLLLVYQYTNNKDKKNSIIRVILMLLLGIIAGWTNENTSFGLIVVLTSLLLVNKFNKEKNKPWQISGVLGNIIGFAIMILAPGNFIRSQRFVDNDFILIKWAKRFINCTTGFYEYCLPIIIALVILFTIYIYNRKKINSLVYVFILGAIFSVYPMVLSPEFPPRSWFGVIVFFTIAIMVFAHKLDDIHKIFKPIMMDIIVVSSVIFIADYLYLVKDINELRGVWNYRVQQIEESKDDSVIEFYEYVSNNSKNPNYQLADIGTEANGWPNEDISLYYGVKEKGIIRYEEAKEE